MPNNHSAARYRVLRWPDVQNLVGLSRSQIHKLIAKEQFPAPIKLGKRASGWIEAEVLTWLEDRIEQRLINKSPGESL